MTTVNDDQGPTWCEWVAAAIDAYPLAKRQWSERSDLIAKARHVFVNEGDAAAASAILGDLVAKSSPADLRNNSAENAEKVRTTKAAPDCSRLLQKRDALLAARNRLRMAKRKNSLQARLDQLKAKIDDQLPGSVRSWQPLQPKEVNHGRIS
jgi:hypothetical protein